MSIAFGASPHHPRSIHVFFRYGATREVLALSRLRSSSQLVDTRLGCGEHLTTKQVGSCVLIVLIYEIAIALGSHLATFNLPIETGTGP